MYLGILPGLPSKMFSVVQYNPNNYLSWAEVPCDGWRGKNIIHPEDNESYDLHDNLVWYLLGWYGVVYYAGPLLYFSVKLFNFEDVIIVIAHVQENMEVRQVPTNPYKLAIHEDVNNLKSTLYIDAFYLIDRFL